MTVMDYEDPAAPEPLTAAEMAELETAMRDKQMRGPLAQRMRERRKELGLSQKALAKKAHISPGTIGNIEMGARRQPRDLLKLADALGVEPHWLLFGAPRKAVAVDSAERRVAEISRSLHEQLSTLGSRDHATLDPERYALAQRAVNAVDDRRDAARWRFVRSLRLIDLISLRIAGRGKEDREQAFEEAIDAAMKEKP